MSLKAYQFQRWQALKTNQNELSWKQTGGAIRGDTYRDVIILDREGKETGVFNLTQHDFQNPEEYDAFTTMLLDVAGK